MNTAETPFEFVTVSYLTRIGNQSAGTLAELLTGLENCSDASIFHHTYQTLGSHHFLTEGFSNDFAQWVLSDTNRNDLAEQLAALDIRDYVSIAALRRDLCRVVGDFCAAFPHFCGRLLRGVSPFCRAVRSGALLLLRKRGSHRALGPKGSNAGRISRRHCASQPRWFLFSFHFFAPAAETPDERLFALARGRARIDDSRGQRQSRRHLHQYVGQLALQAAAADRP